MSRDLTTNPIEQANGKDRMGGRDSRTGRSFQPSTGKVLGFVEAPSAPSARPLDFELPAELEASAPPEARGLKRDQVRLMVSFLKDGHTRHTRFRQFPDLLDPGDVVVINTSGTRNAALHARRADGTHLHLHLSGQQPDGLWIVELRRPEYEGGTKPYRSAAPGDRLALPAGGLATLRYPYRPLEKITPSEAGRIRLWVADIQLPQTVEGYLQSYGFPIRYGYVPAAWPGSFYQTVYAQERGSAEMPSAGRAFSSEGITRLVARGILVVPLTLHTGISSMEEDELPPAEFYRLPQASAWAIQAARRHGGRVIAVGTTVVRALESSADPDGTIRPQEGWTDLIVTPERRLQIVDGLLTGFHEPRSSHLSMLISLMSTARLNEAYQEALQEGYLWHEFGDLHLILP